MPLRAGMQGHRGTWTGLVALALTVSLGSCGESSPGGPDPVASVTVTPGTLGLLVGQTSSLTATPRDAAGHPLAGRIVTWFSASPTVASVNAAGLVTAAAPGTATVTATSEGQNGSASVTVVLVPVASVSVLPGTVNLIAGQTQQLDATPRDSVGNALTGRLVTWASSDTAVAKVSAAGLVTAAGAGTATVTATSEGKSGSAGATVMITGLDFPGSAGVTTTMRFVFTSPMAAYPATYIWRVNPRLQTGYYTAFFHADNNTGIFDGNQEYYGFHPYPDPPLTGTPKWEISIGGGDVLDAPVVFDRWYLQVAVCYKSGGQAFNNYYWDWPDTTKVIRWVGPLQSPGPNPAIIVGDAPWNQGNEVWDGVIRGFQFYDTVMTASQIAQEIAAPGSVRRPWYLNQNPLPTDILDKSGNGHHPSWVGSERPTLWTSTHP